jgi:hypothetical protein
MIYSCFDQNKGLYDYFQDTEMRPINGDLPIPKFPSSTGRIGVPAIEAGRPLPSGAKPAGSGWHARGMVVNCRAAAGTLGALNLSQSSGKMVLGGAAVALGLVYFFGRPARPTTYALSGLAGALVGMWLSTNQQGA